MGQDVALRTPTDEEIERIRKVGSAMVRHEKVKQDLIKQIEGTVWGSGNQATAGKALSPVARQQLADYLEITGAHITRHIDMLGGKPFLNSDYWTDKLNTDPYFIRYEQRDLSPGVTEALRARAKRHGELAKALEEAGDVAGGAKQRAKAMDLDEEADDIAMARAQWSPRPTATSVVETTIYRFMNAAPIEKIRSGEITDIDRYIVRVVECNWAGGHGAVQIGNMTKRDPIGDANPGTTARTRSLRRAAVKGFSAYLQKHEEQIRKLEEAMEAEFEIIQEDRRQITSMHEGPPAVSTGNGEPEVGNHAEAKDLPDFIDDDGPDHEVVQDEPTKVPYNEPPQPPADEEGFDRRDAGKRFFATLRDAGIPDSERKKWVAENGLPESTKKWTQADFERAQDLLVGPTRDEVLLAVEDHELGLEDLSLKHLKKAAPQYLRDWNALRDALAAEEAPAAAPEAPRDL